MKPAARPWGELEKTLGHSFADRALLQRALTHSSYANERKDSRIRDNEAFEFLGDAILGFVVAEMLHRADPNGSEGGKSRRRAALVRATSLAQRAEALGLPAFLRLDRNEERTGGRRKQALWSDAFEAVLAAIHLDAGIDAARGFVQRQFGAVVVAGTAMELARDFKTELQELLQGRGHHAPEYRVLSEEGPPHARTFKVACVIDGKSTAKGEGRTKKQAQQAAAEKALAAYSMTPPPRHKSPS
jgi:ribonuclease-3